MKLLFLLLTAVLLSSTGMAGLPINEKVLKAFNETFRDATQVTWHEAKDLYIVHFVKDAIRYNVTYDRDGKLLVSRRYYREDRLPTQVLLKVKGHFTGKSITGVTEVLDENGLFYDVAVEDAKNLWKVKLDQHDIIEVKRFRKI
jgi:hypothetical protein